MEFVNLTDLCKDFFWIMPQTPKYLEDGEIPYITSKNIKEGIIKFDKYNRISYEDYIKISKNREIIENDFLISMIGTLGEVAIVKKNDLPFYGQNMFLLRLNDDLVDLRFIYYFLISNDTKSKLLGKQNKATQSYLRYNDVVSLKVPAYDKSKQIEIVAEISNILKLIDLNNKTLFNLDNIVKSQFIEMFGDIESCNNTIDLQDICLKITDGSHNPPAGIDFSNNYMISSQNIHDNIIDYKDVRFLSDNDFQTEDKRTGIGLGDVLLTIVGAIGRTAIVKDDLNITCQRSVCVIHPNKDKVNSTFLKYMLDDLSEIIINEARGVAQKGIYLNQVKKLQVICPQIEQQNKFADFVQLTDKSKYIKV